MSRIVCVLVAASLAMLSLGAASDVGKLKQRAEERCSVLSDADRNEAVAAAEQQQSSGQSNGSMLREFREAGKSREFVRCASAQFELSKRRSELTNQKHRKEQERVRVEKRQAAWDAAGGVRGTMEAYLSAKNPIERAKKCYMRGLDRSALVDWYAQHGNFKTPKLESISREAADTYKVCLTGALCFQYYFWFSDTQILVDWPRTVGYNTPTIMASIAKEMKGPRWFWVSGAELSSSYHMGFSNAKGRVQSISFYESSRLNWAYAIRGGDTNVLIQYLSNGPRDLTLQLALGSRDDVSGCFVLVGWKPGHAEIVP